MTYVYIENPINKKFQVEHSLFIICSNLLPNYVAAQLLWLREVESA
jgi:hypothetical protein